MSDDLLLAAVAERLRRAYSGAPVEPLRDVLDSGDATRAYRVQALNTHHWCAEGRRIAGRKIGLTSAANQSALGSDQPNHGVLFADTALEDGALVPLAAGLHRPRVEAEVALVLDHDLVDPGLTLPEMVRAVAYAAAAIEIVDSRIVDWRVTAADMIADNGFAARYVVSPAVRSLAGLDLLTCGMLLEVDDAIASTGVGAACLGHPLRAATWLARTLADSDRPLRAGDIIMTGALGPMVPVAPGARVRVQIGGLGSARVGFEGEPTG